MPLAAPIVAALVSGGASLGSSLLSGATAYANTMSTNKTNLQIARETNQMQLDAMREQNAFNKQEAIDAFNRENEYNHPVAQLQRLREAGLNPYAGTAAGQQVAGNNVGDQAAPQAAGVPTLHAAQMIPAPDILGTAFSNFGTLANALKSLGEAKKVGVDTELLERMTNDLVAEQHNKVLLQELEQQIQGLNLEWMPKKYQAEIDNIKAGIALAAAQTVTEQAKQNNYSADTALKNIQNVLNQMNIRLTRSEIKRIEELLPLEKKVQEAIAYNQTQQGKQAGEAAETTRQTREYIVEKAKQDARLQKQNVRAEIFRNYINSKTLDTQVDQIGKQLELTEAQIKQVKEAARIAKREGNWMAFDKTLGRILGSAGVIAAAFIAKSPAVAAGAGAASVETTPPVPYN